MSARDFYFNLDVEAIEVIAIGALKSHARGIDVFEASNSRYVLEPKPALLADPRMPA
jgi:hypothetical protein